MYFDRLRVKNCWACLIDQRASKLNSYNAVLENKFPDQKREKIAEQMSYQTQDRSQKSRFDMVPSWNFQLRTKDWHSHCE